MLFSALNFASAQSAHAVIGFGVCDTTASAELFAVADAHALSGHEVAALGAAGLQHAFEPDDALRARLRARFDEAAALALGAYARETRWWRWVPIGLLI